MARHDRRQSQTGSSTFKHEPRRVEKPWGYELIWAETSEYVGKTLHVDVGHALSLQYHEIKDETIHVLNRRVKFWTGPSPETMQETELEPDSFRIRPGTVHRIEAVTDCDILEASTPHLEYVVRVEDRYGRTDFAVADSQKKAARR